MIEKVISGGQTGADQAGLFAAREVRIPTGGVAPPFFWTDQGPNRKLLKEFGLIEGEFDPKRYPKRTLRNVRDSDGTVIFGNPSPGVNLTIRYCKSLRKPFIQDPTEEAFVKWVFDNKIKVLNVAGNRERTNPGISQRVFLFLEKALVACQMATLPSNPVG